MTPLKQLLALSSEAIAPTLNTSDYGRVINELVSAVLRCKNGFFAFESALLVRPLSRALPPLGIVEWNAENGWRSAYRAQTGDCIFFAENLFGEQFGLSPEGIFLFDPETGDLKKFAGNLETWAERILEKPGSHTGHPLAQKWQKMNGALKSGERLVPSLPFVLGGGFNVDNLVKKADFDAMKIRAFLANQISDLPDGASIQFELIE